MAEAKIINHEKEDSVMAYNPRPGRLIAGLAAATLIFSAITAACSPAATPSPTTAPSKPAPAVGAPTAAPAAAPTSARAPAPTTVPAAPAPTTASVASAAKEPSLQGAPATGGPFKVGASVDASVALPALYGWVKNAFDLAIEDLGNAGWTGDKKPTYILEDNKADPKLGLASAQKLIQVDGVNYIVSTGGAIIVAMAPLMIEKQTVLMNMGTGVLQIRDASKGWTFSNFPSYQSEVVANAGYAAKQLKAKKAAIIYLNNDFGLGVRDLFKAEFEKQGGQIVAAESNAVSQGDFRTQLTKIKGAAPDIIFLGNMPVEAGNAIKNASEMGYKVQFMGLSNLTVKEVQDIAGSAMEGMITTSLPFDPDGNNPLARDFGQRWFAKTNQKANIYQALSYDSMILVANAWKAGAKTGKEIRDYLAAIKSYTGPAGTYSFDKDLQAQMPLRLVQWQQGRFVTIVDQF